MSKSLRVNLDPCDQAEFDVSMSAIREIAAAPIAVLVMHPTSTTEMDVIIYGEHERARPEAERLKHPMLSGEPAPMGTGAAADEVLRSILVAHVVRRRMPGVDVELPWIKWAREHE